MTAHRTTPRWDAAAQKRIVERFKWLVYESGYHTTVNDFCDDWGINKDQLQKWGMQYLGYSLAEWRLMIQQNGNSTTLRRMKQRRKRYAAEYAERCEHEC
jgi:hypothetical protein